MYGWIMREGILGRVGSVVWCGVVWCEGKKRAGTS